MTEKAWFLIFLKDLTIKINPIRPGLLSHSPGPAGGGGGGLRGPYGKNQCYH